MAKSAEDGSFTHGMFGNKASMSRDEKQASNQHGGDNRRSWIASCESFQNGLIEAKNLAERGRLCDSDPVWRREISFCGVLRESEDG